MSIVEIAKLAGVSHTTVARVVNSPEDVRPETVEKVRGVMEQVGYVPKPKSQRRGPKRTSSKGFKTGNVAFLTSSEGFHILGYSPVMMNVVHGIEEALASYGMSMIQGTINSNRQLPPIVSRGEVDGVIIWPDFVDVSEETLEILNNYQRVYLMTGRERYLSGDRVLNNNEKVGVLAAEYLTLKGHRKILQIDFDDEHRSKSAWIERWYGFEEYSSTTEAKRLVVGIRSNETLQLTLPNEKSIFNSLKEVFGKDDYPTGIFCTCDSLTAMIYPLIQRMGIIIGKDVQIVSCNNERSILAGLDPLPASIDICPEEIGRCAVEQLRWRVANPDDTSKRIVEIEPRLVVPGL